MLQIFSLLGNIEDTNIDCELLVKEGDKIKSIRSCLRCRKVKRSCDRSLPSCSRCDKYEAKCQYSKQDIKLPNSTTTKDNAGREYLFTQENLNMSTTELVKGIRREGCRMSIITNQKLKEFGINYHIDAKINWNYRSIALVRMMLRSSSIDVNDTIVYKSTDGNLEYHGQSPVGSLLVAYYNLNSILKENRPKAVESNKVINKINLSQDLEFKLVNKYVLEECCAAYFKYFALFCPVISEEFLARHPTPFLTKLVVAVGCKYLPMGCSIPGLIPYLDNQLMLQYIESSRKVTMDIAISIIIIGQYQVAVKEFRRNCMFTSYYPIYLTMFGLGRKPHNKMKLSNKQKRLRVMQWWAATIGDKIHSLLLNRPMVFNTKDWEVEYPPQSKLKILSKDPTNDEFIIGRDHASFIYFETFAHLCDLIGYGSALLKFKFQRFPEQAHPLCQQLIVKMLSRYKKFVVDINETMRYQPQWYLDMCRLLLATNFNAVHGFIIHISRYFLKDLKHPNFPIYLKISIESADKVIQNAKDLDEGFLRYGVMFRYYNLSSAILVHTFVLKMSSKFHHHFNIKELEDMLGRSKFSLESGLKILELSQPYNPIVTEFFNQLSSLDEF